MPVNTLASMEGNNISKEGGNSGVYMTLLISKTAISSVKKNLHIKYKDI